MSLRIEFLSAISQCSAQQWNELAGTDYPFLRHEFLAALEQSGSVCQETGWDPQHALVYKGAELVALMPLYRKHHSYGEFVFDWNWADAYHRAGWHYYPKWVCAIPFTPATGPRMVIRDGYMAEVLPSLKAGLLDKLSSDDCSGLHILFPDRDQANLFQNQGFLVRQGVQYHWLNQGYGSFDHFIGEFSSRKRKNLNKERRRVYEQGVTFRVFTGHELSETRWDDFYHFYQITYARYSGHGGYLSREFFSRISQTMAQQVILVMAYQNGHTIAGALNYRSDSCLYGRHWGTAKEVDYLHFEACYYQGIDYCTANGLKKFDPGAQGEHKISRGFTPLPVYSCHWLTRPQARHAVGDFIRKETLQINEYIQHASETLPFKVQTR